MVVFVIVMADASVDIKPNVRAVEGRIVMRVCAVLRGVLEEVGYRCVRLVSAYAIQVGLRSTGVTQCSDKVTVMVMIA